MKVAVCGAGITGLALANKRAAIRYSAFARTMRDRLCGIMRTDLERALREHLPAGVDLRFGAEVTGVDDLGDHVRVTAGGQAVEADVAVGADGVHSVVRRLVFGEDETFLRYLGFHTAAFVLADPEIAAAVRDRFCLTDSVGRQMGFYGLRDGRVAAFAVHRTADRRLPEDPRAALRQEYRSLGWLVPRALQQCPPAGEVYYDHVAQVEMPGWSRGRVVLAGDACYAVSLLAGQGASLGVAGAWVLGEQLVRAPSAGEAFAEYERLLRPVITEKQDVARRSSRWFLPTNPTQLVVRRAVLGLARLPLMDRVVASVLAGKPTAVVADLHRASAGAPR